MRLSAEIGLPVTVERAWEVLTDWESQTAWMEDADGVALSSTSREGVGVAIDVKTRVLGVPAFTERLEVVAWDPPGRLTMRHRGMVGGEGEWRLVSAGDGCRFRWTETLSLPPPMLGELALLIYRPFMRRLMARSGAALRTLLDQERASGG